MRVNVGTVDRIIRVGIGVIAAIIAIYLGNLWSLIPGLVAVIALGTALSGRCGVYTLFGVNTHKVK
jgi:hypothetical protein